MSAPMIAERVAPSQDTAWRLLRTAARLLLEYNERSALIKAHLERLASRLNVPAAVAVAYRDVTLGTPDGRMFRADAPELRIDTAVSIATLRAIDDLCAGRIDADQGLRRVESLERTSARHGRFVVAAVFGLAAAALAALLGADWGAIGSSGASAALGLIARQQIAKVTRTRLVLPFAAALVGAVIGGVAIRSGWTATRDLCLIVPALMVVPGPHLINGVQDVLENEIAAGIGRLWLAAAILLAAALGVMAGVWLVVGAVAGPASGGRVVTLVLVNVALAGVASAGFAAAQNSPWRVMAVSVACGALGYAIRAGGLSAGLGLALASLAACLAIGIAAGVSSDRLHLPFASVAFASAAPLIPGLLIYQSIAGAMRIAAAGLTADPALAVAMLSPSVDAAAVVAAMVVGLVVGDRFAEGLERFFRSV